LPVFVCFLTSCLLYFIPTLSFSNPQQSPHTTGGLFFQPLGLEEVLPPDLVPSFSRYHCTAQEAGTNKRLSVTPIPCACPKIDLSRLNDSFCEVDLSPASGGVRQVEEALLHRSRSLSLVRGAVSYVSSSAALVGLNKLFEPDTMSSGGGGGGGGKNGAVR
jgi:hypothetical protein